MATESIEPGQLRHHGEFQRLGPTKDALGQFVEDWQTITEAWARIRPLTSRERSLQMQAGADVTYEIMTRYIEGIRASDRFLYRGRHFELVGEPRNIREVDHKMVFNAIERTDG